MTDKAHLLAQLAALSEMAQRIEQIARDHRAAGPLDMGYLRALEDMIAVLGKMLRARMPTG